ncbi:MAG: family 43 glycosylhydrolase [Fibrobacteraceae bacterium]
MRKNSLTAIAFTLITAAFSYAATVSNPIIWADVPDVSMLRVDSTYYMVSTTMHFAPGVPVMASTDLANWRTVNYAYSTLTNSDAMNLNAGKSAYGKGSWASSIRYHDGTYYILTPSYTTNKTHLYKTKDIKSGTWSETLLPFYHDPSLFFDDDGSAYIFYGSGSISYVQLNSTLTGTSGKSGTLNLPLDATTGTGSYTVKMEGSHMEKVNGKYYLFVISWPSGKCRTEIVFRSSSLFGSYEGKIVLQNNGIAQGSIFDTPDGKWYAMLFRDHGAVGRIPYLIPVAWSNDWPVLGTNGAAPSTLTLDNPQTDGYGMVTSDDFDEEVLPLEWQWNHNPDNANWSLSANKGSLRITTSRTDNGLYYAKNTLTQRSFGPKCSGRIALDAGGMKDGDFAGLAALQDSMAFVGVSKSGSSLSIVEYQGKSQKASVPVSQNKVYLRIDMDFTNQTDKATFYYSLDSTTWKSIGSTLSMSYTLGMFVGYRFSLFNYATKSAGGYADFDWFKIGKDYTDEIQLTTKTVAQAPYADTLALPGTIEAENYDVGGQGVSYSDNESANQGDVYRTDGVDIVSITGGYAVGYTVDGEWLEYTVKVAKAGVYTFDAAVASGSVSSSFQLFLDNAAITDTVKVDSSSWTTYSSVSGTTKTLTAGTHVLKIAITGSYVNIDKVTFTDGTTKIESSPAHRITAGTYRIFDMQGVYLGSVPLSGNRSEDVPRVRNTVKRSGLFVLKDTGRTFIVNTKE